MKARDGRVHSKTLLQSSNYILFRLLFSPNSCQRMQKSCERIWQECFCLWISGFT